MVHSFNASWRFKRTAAVALMLLGAGHTSIADDVMPIQATTAAIRLHESKQWMSDFRRGSLGPSGYKTILQFYCFSALMSARSTDAVRDCGEVIAMSPDEPTGYKLRGMAYFIGHRYDAALTDLDRAAALDSHDAQTQSGRGAVFRERGQTDLALEAYSRAIAIEPRVSKWWNARCWTRAIARRELPQAQLDCNEAVRLDPHSAMAYDSRGLVYLQLGRSRAAVREYSKALAIKPRLITALFGRGAAKLRLRDRSGHSDIARARDIEPTIDQTFARYGIVVKSPFQLRRRPQPGPCGGAECPAITPSPKVKPSLPGNDAIPARSARVEPTHRAPSMSR